MKRHVVLVGLPGSGKSTVGALAASQLGAPFIDLDQEIAARAGRSVAELFRDLGEPGFRKLEGDAARVAFAGAPAVLAPGGGWAAQPGALDAARPVSFIIYLSVPPELAASRCGDAAARPLLAGAPAGERLTVLYEERSRFYELADAVVSNSDLSPAAAALRIAELARHEAGW